jgi:hypothetical protein
MRGCASRRDDIKRVHLPIGSHRFFHFLGRHRRRFHLRFDYRHARVLNSELRH